MSGELPNIKQEIKVKFEDANFDRDQTKQNQFKATTYEKPIFSENIQQQSEPDFVKTLYDRKLVNLPINTIEEKWKLLPAFLQTRGLVKEQIDSYNYLVNVEIRKILDANRQVRCDSDPNFFLEYTDIWVGHPSIVENMMERRVTPQECRLRDLTYSAPIYVNLRYTRGRDELVVAKEVCIGRIPVMLRSTHCILYQATDQQLALYKECPLDPGGYFIIRGVEKVILIQEQLSKNRMIVELDSKQQICASVTSSTHERKSKTTIYMRHSMLYLKHNTFQEDLPIVIVLKAMGMETDQEVVQLVGSEPELIEWLSPSLHEAAQLGISTQSQAIHYLGDRIRSFNRPRRRFRPKSEEVPDILAQVVLNHIPVIRYDMRLKCIYISCMLRRILDVARGKAIPSDKDYYGNKRLELAGQLLALLFEDLFKQFNAVLQKMTDNVLSKPSHLLFDIAKTIAEIQHDVITQGMATAISSGNWKLKRFKMERAGVTQVLSRLSFIAVLGMMTRIQSQFERTRKISGPRSLQASQWGVLCPADTPEGESCGLVKNLALLAHVTSDQDADQMASLALNLGVEDVRLLSGEELNAPSTYIVFLNGMIIGIHLQPDQLINNLRRLRRKNALSPYVAIHVDRLERAIHLATDGGRLCRPLIVVNPNGQPRITTKHIQQLSQKLITFDDMVHMGLIEYLDVNEETNSQLALYECEILPGKTTHLEIDPLTILGVCAGLIPYPNHNQSPRNTYQCAMGKQSMGTVAYNQLERFDTLLYVLAYPQRPLVETRHIPLIGFDKLPAGQNAVVAVMSYSGYDIEDALVLNRASLDRGFGRCSIYKKQACIVRHGERLEGPPGSSSSTNPSNPNPVPLTGAMRKYAALDVDGLASPGLRLMPGDTCVNRLVPLNAQDQLVSISPTTEWRNSSLTFRGRNPVYIDRVMLAAGEDDDQLVVKVQLRETRRPELGDKFSSRHGQKGVVGLIVDQVDLPFNDQGICPDIVMNPHGFPSRMTVGKLMELLTGKASTLRGKTGLGTAFSGESMKPIGELLVKHGFSYEGKDILTSGITGECLQAYIYFGPVYYQKLKHMVADKMHARARGPRALLTRQPTEGRSKDGGLRLGEMERDCLIGYGASSLLLERLMLSSDAFVVHTCQKCGLIGYAGWCQNCQSSLHMANLTIPYAAKLLFQELQSMNIVPRLKLEDM